MGISVSCPEASRTRATAEEAGYSPSPRIQTISPSTFGGTWMRWRSRGVSWTVARTVPGVAGSPTLATGTRGKRRSPSSMGTDTPAVRKMPSAWSSAPRGRPIPSKKEPISPGPRATERVSPVESTGSPTFIPWVSS